jgi:hypothetical protein
VRNATSLSGVGLSVVNGLSGLQIINGPIYDIKWTQQKKGSP